MKNSIFRVGITTPLIRTLANTFGMLPNMKISHFGNPSTAAEVRRVLKSAFSRFSLPLNWLILAGSASFGRRHLPDTSTHMNQTRADVREAGKKLILTEAVP